MSTEFWNERYAGEDLVYGDAPNTFLAASAGHMPKAGLALDLGAGEGRNALFLASLGLDTTAVDQSEVGLAKAQRRARDRKLTLHTTVADLNVFDPPLATFDVISSIFVHLPSPLRSRVLRRLPTWLRPGGVFILESYAPDQIERDTGGPKDPDMLAPLESILADLRVGDPSITIIHEALLVREVIEGAHHSGESSVVQMIAKKA
ncbi:MAG: class I SAM-dependent methyltransferase [Phycisphaerales bacterium]|nr:MAG: class I SAM-dependent methyltransferase [Phycisphaerales bacterium]